jgi:hypothetical protein
MRRLFGKMQSVLIDFQAVSGANSTELLTLLQDIQTASVLQLGNRKPGTLVERVGDMRLRNGVKAVLTRLRERNRILTCADIGTRDPCAVNAFECIEERRAATIIVGAAASAEDNRTTRLDDYLTSPWRVLLTSHELTFFNRQVRQEWDRRVWRPLFRAARRVTIIDYMAGHNPAGFAPTFLWLHEQIATSLYPVSVVLYTAIDHDSSGIRRLCRDREWELQLRRYAPNVNDSLPHDRYIITERLGLQVGRGFNLCYEGNQDVQDSAVHVCEDTASIINKAHRAPRIDRA